MGGVPSKADPSKKIEVIVAGYARTGTMSTCLALERLLDGPVIHGGTNFFLREDSYCKTWINALQAHERGEKEQTMKYLQDLTNGYVACADLPYILVVPELVEMYPDAKVILVTRDPKKWWKSFEKLTAYGENWLIQLIVCIAPGLRWIPTLDRQWRKEMNALLGASPDEHVEYGPAIIEAHNKLIKDTVSKDRLLVIDIMDLGEGWEPLCNFLGKPVPDAKFPRVNDADALDRFAGRLLAKVAAIWLGVFTVAGGVLYMGCRLSHG